jgi:hypothetical protein
MIMPNKRNGAEQRHEAEGLIEQQQEQRDADDAERRGQQHHDDA